MPISEEIKKLCRKTRTSISGMKLLINYYENSLGWSSEEANEYAKSLFADGTIKKIEVVK